MAATDTKRATKNVPGAGLYQPPAMRAAKITSDCQIPADSSMMASTNSGSRASKAKRPDMQMYVPRARRQVADSPPETAAQNTPPPPKSTKIRNSSPNVVTPRKKSANKGANNKKLSSAPLGNQSQSCDSDTSSCDLLDDNGLIAEEDKKVTQEVQADFQDTVDVTIDTSTEDKLNVKSSDDECWEEAVDDSGVGERELAISEAKSAEPSVLKQSEVLSAPKFVAQDLSAGDDSWDTMFDDSGECLDPKLLNELTHSLGKVKVEQPSSDYSSYAEAREMLLAETDYSHVLEVHGFQAEFKTQDLIAILNPFAGRSGFDLKWVDDTHALAIFSNSVIAAEVLSVHHPMLKVRPLSQATAESKSKAKKCPQTLRPYKPRPETCSAMAKRMVSSALGVKLVTSKEEREKEKNILREAREKKRLAVKQLEDAWEGKIGNCK